MLARGLAAAEQIGALNEIARCLGQLGWAHLLLSDETRASALAARAEHILAEVTAPPGSAFLFGTHAHAAVARVLLATGAPERGEALMTPILEAASRSGWREAAAISELVLGLCLSARDESPGAFTRLDRARQLAHDYGIPAVEWEAHAALAPLADDPDEHLTHVGPSPRPASHGDLHAAGRHTGTPRTPPLADRAPPRARAHGRRGSRTRPVRRPERRGATSPFEPSDDRGERLFAVAVLIVEQLQVDRAAAREGEGPPILLDAVPHPLRRVRRTRVPIPPRPSIGVCRHAREYVDDRHLARLREHMPAREHRVVEVRGENHGDHRPRTIPTRRGATVNRARMLVNPSQVGLAS